MLLSEYERTSTTVGSAVLLVTLILTAACAGSKPDYSDNPDLKAMRQAFSCNTDKKASEPCRALRGFERGGKVKTFGIYLGVAHYSTKPTATFKTFNVKPIPIVKTANSPGASMRSLMSSYQLKKRQLVIDTVDALAAHADAPPVDPDGLFPSTWSAWAERAQKTIPGGGAAEPVAQSDGNSLLHAPGSTPAWWDDAEPRDAFGYYRQRGEELIYIRPPTKAGDLGHEAHVVRAYRLLNP